MTMPMKELLLGLMIAHAESWEETPMTVALRYWEVEIANFLKTGKWRMTEEGESAVEVIQEIIEELAESTPPSK